MVAVASDAKVADADHQLVGLRAGTDLALVHDEFMARHAFEGDEGTRAGGAYPQSGTGSAMRLAKGSLEWTLPPRPSCGRLHTVSRRTSSSQSGSSRKARDLSNLSHSAPREMSNVRPLMGPPAFELHCSAAVCDSSELHAGHTSSSHPSASRRLGDETGGRDSENVLAAREGVPHHALDPLGLRCWKRVGFLELGVIGSRQASGSS